jgi:hypothetical protein
MVFDPLRAYYNSRTESSSRMFCFYTENLYHLKKKGKRPEGFFKKPG